MPKVYVSSTYSDLKDYREAVARALRRMKKEVVAMEDYVATDQRPLDKCLGDVTACDVYVGILAWRYGYVPHHHDNPDHKSITELEYREATRLGKVCLLFLLDESVPWPRGSQDAVTGEGERGQRIDALRAELNEQKLVSFFRSADDLATLVSTAVAQWEDEQRPSAESIRKPAAVIHQPREVNRHLYLTYTAVDEPFARHLAQQLEPRGRSMILSPRALFAEQPADFQELEQGLRRCHATAVVLSDAALNQLEEQHDRTRRILNILKARTGRVLALCRSEASLRRVEAMSFSKSLDLQLWRPDVEPPMDLLGRVDREVVAGWTRPEVRAVGLPFMIVAMTDGEAQELERHPEIIKSGLGVEALAQFGAIKQSLDACPAPTFVERYGPAREQWRPFTESDQTIRSVIEEIVTYLNRSEQPRLLGRSIKIQHYPFDELLAHDQLLRPVYLEVAQSGCVVLIDEFSLFHPRVLNTLLDPDLFNSPQVALVTIAPFNPYGMPPHYLLELENRLSEQMAEVLDRLTQDYDQKCEFNIGDERRLKRWLHNSLPQTLQGLRDPRPNQQALDRFAAELGKERTLNIAGLLYSEGSGL